MTKVRILLFIAVTLVPVALSAGQASEDTRGWSFSERFQGTSNDAGFVFKMNSTLAYKFNGHVQTYTGLPVYADRPSSSIATSPSFSGGIGNAYAGLLLNANPASLHYASDLMLGAPTGDKSKGLGTGHATVDWTNTFSHAFSALTPYASVGAGNTISDTSFFVRPFTTNGAVIHFEVGALVDVTRHVSVGASGYGLRAHGQQEVVSKVVESKQQPVTTAAGDTLPVTTPVSQIPPLQGVTSTLPAPLNPGKGLANGLQSVLETSTVTTTTPDAINDQGFSTWLSLKVNSSANFQLGYSRSTAFQLNSVFFGVGFRAGK